MKYLYCPRCKDLRVKSWYAIRDICPLCFGPATAIKIPNTWMTYALYMLYLVTPALVVIYLWQDDWDFLYAAVIGLALMVVLLWVEVGRGMAYARTKIKVTSGDLGQFRQRGWG